MENLEEKKKEFGETVNASLVSEYFKINGAITNKVQIPSYIKGVLDKAWISFVMENPDLTDFKKEIIAPFGSKVSSILISYFMQG